MAGRYFSKLRRAVAFTLLAAGMQGCGCDAWGCLDGLRVMFDAAPTGPWQVELFVNGVVQAAPANASCDGGPQCGTVVRYNILPRDNVSVRITTNAGVRTTEFPRITYIGKSARFDCHDCKGQAEVIGRVP